jgi:uncharacterized protein (TIGR04222 family)
MFPLDLPGPQFLVFYGLFAAAVIAVLHFVRRQHESFSLPQIDLKDLKDPFLFACLRGGPREVACIATLGLIDRGILQISDRIVRRSPDAGPHLVGRRIEKQVLFHFDRDAELFSIMKERSVLAVAAAEYEGELRRHRLIPDDEMRRARRRFMLAASACLIAVGGAKLLVALGAGRSNVLFLIVMMAIAVAVVWKVGSPYRATVGDSYLASIRSMFSGLRNRVSSIRPGSGSRELLWLTSLFGVSVLPTAAFPFVTHFKRNTTSGSGCGSSCGSAGGAGGGCGGGGGGGGGCGGCGS